MNGLLAECRFPKLDHPYDQALREAVGYIVQHFDVLGIVAAGSIIRGEGRPTSDLDIYAIHAKPQRQLIQRYFGNVPTQIFLNPPHMIEDYFRSESQTSKCSTAHMLTTGFVVLDRDPVVDSLRKKAKAFLEQPSSVAENQLTATRYYIADQYENALDVAKDDPGSAVMIAGQAVFAMLQFYFRRQGICIPRDKDLLKRLDAQDQELGALARAFYAADNVEAKLQTAALIADKTIQTRGFFEWESPLEQV